VSRRAKTLKKLLKTKIGPDEARLSFRPRKQCRETGRQSRPRASDYTMYRQAIDAQTGAETRSGT